MKVLITGGAGYAGSVLTRQLLGEGHEVCVLDCLLYGGQGLQGISQKEPFQLIEGDIRSASVVKRVLPGVDAVVHLAAIVGDPACARQPALAREANLDASLQLFELSRQNGVKRFLFASTCSNYGKMQDRSQFLTEESELRPVSLYAETKVAVEKTLLSSSNGHGLCVTVLRFATLYGLSPRMRWDLTVNEFTLELLTKCKVTLYGEQFWRPYLHIGDAARAIALVLASPIECIVAQAFNVGDTTQNFQKIQLVEMIRKEMPHPVDVEIVKKEEDPRDYRVSFEKIGRKLGFHPIRTVEDGIREIRDAISQKVITDFDDPRYRN